MEDQEHLQWVLARNWNVLEGSCSSRTCNQLRKWVVKVCKFFRWRSRHEFMEFGEREGFMDCNQVLGMHYWRLQVPRYVSWSEICWKFAKRGGRHAALQLSRFYWKSASVTPREGDIVSSATRDRQHFSNFSFSVPELPRLPYYDTRACFIQYGTCLAL